MPKLILTSFVCSQCGNSLYLNTDTPITTGKNQTGEPIDQIITIDPCECVTNQLEKIKQATQTLLQITEPS